MGGTNGMDLMLVIMSQYHGLFSLTEFIGRSKTHMEIQNMPRLLLEKKNMKRIICFY